MKEIGYQNVQLSGHKVTDAEVIRDISRETGMEIVVTHYPPERILNETEALIEEHKIFGCPVIGIGAMPKEYRDGAEGVQRFIKDFTPAVEKIEACPNWLFTADVYWFEKGDCDAETYLRKIGADRLVNVHFKDMDKTEDRGICACGDGIIDFVKLTAVCEKPAGVYTKQVKEMNEVAKKSDKLFTMVFNQRTNCVYRKIREMIQSGELGAIKRVNWIVTDWYRSQFYYDSGDWRATWRGEVGVMINQALHTLDLLQWICGMPTRVISTVGNWTHEGIIEVEDTASARFETADGLPINFFATTSAGTSLPITVQITLADKTKICAQNGFLVVNDELCPIASGGRVKQGKEVWGVEHATLIDEFYRCILAGEHFPIDVEEGGRVVRLILAMYCSDGKSIEIPN